MRQTAEEEYQVRLAEAIESAKKVLEMAAWRTSSELTILDDEDHKPVLRPPFFDQLICKVAIDGLYTRIHFEHDFLLFQQDPRAAQAQELRHFDKRLGEIQGRRMIRMQLINLAEQDQGSDDYEYLVNAFRYYKEDRQQIESLLGENLSGHVGKLVFSDAPKDSHYSGEVAAEYQPIKEIEFYRRYDQLGGLALAEIIGSVLDVSNPPYDDLFDKHPIKTALSQLYLEETRATALVLLCDCHPLGKKLKGLLGKELLSRS